ncbi:hypothetical protein K402DRAFT_35419 [Aulographum hederae CBS 113979]|uniref:Nuclear speckle splicing regulatory protein 1 N-terminal domain-containing protein n=1 Tax=Aulographum hederae CBS 113979 TaxID=1176131 RepID=A0A6G1H460_9PEZI|nr:hypothetical protein K402DRAFT_35419 [Aulographum hederae CBS 113979]
MSGFKIGLNVKKKPAPSTSRRNVFGDDDSDLEDSKAADGPEEIGVFDLDNDRSTSTSTSKQAKPKSGAAPKASSKGRGVSMYGDISSMKASQKHIDKALEVDPSIYDYDAAFDAIHAKDAAKKEAEKLDALERKPKYMKDLLATAEVRKRDSLRAKEKMLQKEREAEGEEFAHKETFVTDAYRAQQEENARLEEEERKREAEEERKKKGKGMQGFYKSVMDMEEQKHEEAMQAAEEAVKSGKPITQEDKPKEKTDAELAAEANARGADVIVNDEGLIADKRQLLTAGLNVAPKPKNAPASAKGASRPDSQRQSYRSVHLKFEGTRERQTRLVEDQLSRAAKRAADEEAEELRKREHMAKSQKTEGEISSAKERYLQRKREAAEAAKKAEATKKGAAA